MDEFEITGQWWLPSKIDNKKWGHLSFSHTDGFLLEIYGNFSLEKVGSGIVEEQHYPLIEGLSRGGKRFSIFECFSTNPLAFSGETFVGNYVFETSDAGSGGSLATKFRKAQFQFTYLSDWIGTSSIREKWSFSDDTKLVDRFEVTYKPPEKQTVDLVESKVSTVEGFSKREDAITGITLKSAISLEVEIADDMSFEEWIDKFLTLLQNLVTLATQRPNAVTEFSLFSGQNRVETHNGFRDSVTKVYYQQLVARNKRKTRTIDERGMLFTFQDIQNELGPTLKNWFSVNEKFRSSLDLFFAVRMSNGMYLNHEFLNLVQALEVYHRSQFDDSITPKNEFKAKKKEIIESVPEQHCKWLIDQLAYSNQPRLSQRISELLEHTDDVSPKLVQNTAEFTRKVTNTRNFLTHYSRKKQVMEKEELAWAARVLSYILQMCWLLELGFSKERCSELFSRNQNFLFTISQLERRNYWGAEEKVDFSQ